MLNVKRDAYQKFKNDVAKDNTFMKDLNTDGTYAGEIMFCLTSTLLYINIWIYDKENIENPRQTF